MIPAYPFMDFFEHILGLNWPEESKVRHREREGPSVQNVVDQCITAACLITLRASVLYGGSLSSLMNSINGSGFIICLQNRICCCLLDTRPLQRLYYHCPAQLVRCYQVRQSICLHIFCPAAVETSRILAPTPMPWPCA